MNLIDIVALVLIGLGAWRGVKNGMIKEVAGLLGLVIGVWAGMRLAFVFANYYRDNFDIPDNYIPLIAFLTAFLLGIGVVYLLGRLLHKVVHSVALGLPNRAAGAVFGAAKWAFLVGTLLSLIGGSKLMGEETIEGSKAYPILNTYCKGVQNYTIGLVPAASNVFNDVEDYFVGLDSTRNARQGMPVNFPGGDSTVVEP